EVAVDHEERGAREALIVERMIRPRGAVVLEEVRLQPFEGRRAQKARRHDAIRVDIVAAQRHPPAADRQNRRARALPGGPSAAALRLSKGHAGTRSIIARTSTTSPAIAAAATIAGLISSVRPVGLPWRPLKLRFDDEAHTCRPSSRSVFMPRHIEQPAPRHSKPARRNTSSSPRASASRLTRWLPGTTSAFTRAAT